MVRPVFLVKLTLKFNYISNKEWLENLMDDFLLFGVTLYRMCRVDIYSSRLDLGRHGDVADKDYLGRLSGIYAGVLTNDSSLISSPASPFILTPIS